jgi:hypothetical protein
MHQLTLNPKTDWFTVVYCLPLTTSGCPNGNIRPRLLCNHATRQYRVVLGPGRSSLPPAGESYVVPFLQCARDRCVKVQANTTSREEHLGERDSIRDNGTTRNVKTVDWAVIWRSDWVCGCRRHPEGTSRSLYNWRRSEYSGLRMGYAKRINGHFGRSG